MNRTKIANLTRAGLTACLALALTVGNGCGERVGPPAPKTVTLFEDVTVHFTPVDSSRFDSPFATARDNGRIMATYREFTPPPRLTRISLRLALRPIRLDMRNVVDRWDRAGSLRLVRPGAAPVELMRFMTPYGGAVEHEVDISRYLPLLTGLCRFEVFIDTWVSPAWKVDADLTFAPADPGEHARAAWARGALLPPGGLTAAASTAETTVVIPDGLRRIELAAISTGHCTDGTDADEFITKDNVISVDGREVFRWRPWRDDCKDFRAINPYCARWSDGSWSADYSRSGWCPGDVAEPEIIDLTEWLTPGEHILGLHVEDIRPADGDGQHGYWRVSGGLTGWR